MEAESQIKLLDQEPYTTSGQRTYYLYIWLDKDETSMDTMDQPFILTFGGQCSDTLATSSSAYTESILNGTDPVLEEGMIPVTISDTGAVTSADTTQAWYSYENQQWANAILVNSFETAHTTLSSSTTSDNLECTTIDCSNADGLIIKPNVTPLRYNSVSNMFYASRSMTRTDNPFGLTTKTDTHMMKNSEWGCGIFVTFNIRNKSRNKF